MKKGVTLLVFTVQCLQMGLFLGAFGSNRAQPKTGQKGAVFSMMLVISLGI